MSTFEKGFRWFMEFMFFWVALLATFALWLGGIFGNALIEPYKTIGMYLHMYAPMVLIALIFGANYIIQRHFKRLDQMKQLVEPAGGQVYVDSVLEGTAKCWLDATDVDEMDRRKTMFQDLSNWVIRLGYRVRGGLHAYIDPQTS